MKFKLIIEIGTVYGSGFDECFEQDEIFEYDERFDTREEALKFVKARHRVYAWYQNDDNEIYVMALT